MLHVEHIHWVNYWRIKFPHLYHSYVSPDDFSSQKKQSKNQQNGMNLLTGLQWLEMTKSPGSLRAKVAILGISDQNKGNCYILRESNCSLKIFIVRECVWVCVYLCSWVVRNLADILCLCARHFSNQHRSMEQDSCSLSLFNWEKMLWLHPPFYSELRHFVQKWGLLHNHFMMYPPKKVNILWLHHESGAAYRLTPKTVQ